MGKPEPVNKTMRSKMISKALELHHTFVKEYYTPVMTVLVGSQNYDLDTEDSDFDTCTFVLPKAKDIATLHDPVSTQCEDIMGHINIKDIRHGLNLLKKTSPNSVEWFATRYRLVEDEFAPLCEIPNVCFRCNTTHMMSAIKGLAYQLGSRNMAPGKRLSHILRMECMVYRYFDLNADILSMTEDERKLALQAKLDPYNPKWDELIPMHIDIVHEAVRNVDKDYFKNTETYAVNYLTDLQMEFMKKVKWE